MDNQHRKISGYTELTQEQIDLMNRVRAQGVELEALVGELRSLAHRTSTAASYVDPRWISIGATDLQTGLMALTRAITKSTFF